MKIFIICCLLFIHVNICIYIMHLFIESPHCSYYVTIQSGFRVSAGLVLGGLSPESVFGAVLGFNFGFRVRVHRDSTRSEFTTLPSLVLHVFFSFLLGRTSYNGTLIPYTSCIGQEFFLCQQYFSKIPLKIL
jgi:hypothetical protein